jgi:hypothetical protein
LRIGIELGRTRIDIAALGPLGEELPGRRLPGDCSGVRCAAWLSPGAPSRRCRGARFSL